VKATYKYLADGTKLSATADTTFAGAISLHGDIVYVTQRNGFDYLGSLVYKTNNNARTLESTSFGGGRINRTDNNSYDINYFITDHLGSTRAIVNANGEIKEQKDFYPFGKEHENGNLMTSTNRWGFNGKEKQTIKDLGWLDFSARMLSNDTDPTIWTTQDPLQEKFYSWSSYNYCMGNPLKFVDPNGKWPTTFFGIRIIGTDVHKRILKKAFQNELKSGEITKKQLNIMAKAGRNWDRKHQGADESYTHSMTDGTANQSVEEAQDKRDNDFIKPRVEIFLDTEKSEEERFTALGEALHAITDEDTPTHQWKSWKGEDSEGAISHTLHEIPVTKTTKKAMQKSIEAAKRFYELIKDRIDELETERTNQH
jgi:RHS repeat-associated protein